MKGEKSDRRTQISVVLMLALLAFILVSGAFLPDANAFGADKLAAPSLGHPFGTDQFGRDVLLRTIHGFRYTFLFALTAQAASFVLGLCLGVLLGWHGGVLDEVFYHFANFLLSFPMIILAILLAALTGANMFYLLLLIVLCSAVNNAKIVRSEVAVIKNADYIRTLRVVGAGDLRIMRDHLLPKCARVLLPSFALMVGHVIISVSAYSFLGYGVQPPDPEIGTMLKESVRFMGSAPWLMILPGLFQFFAALLILNASAGIKRLTLDRRGAKDG